MQGSWGKEYSSPLKFGQQGQTHDLQGQSGLRGSPCFCVANIMATQKGDGKGRSLMLEFGGVIYIYIAETTGFLNRLIKIMF